MQTIKLTNAIDGKVFRISSEHIVAYGPAPDSGSDVILTIHDGSNCVQVKETADEIDKLLSEAV